MQASKQAPKILIVDDEPLVLRSMQKTLQRAGFEVVAAGNCTDAYRTFCEAETANEPFNLAVLDLNMPNFEGLEASGAGLELLARLKEKQPSLMAIVLTAYDEVNKAKDAINLGAQGYCVKGREQSLLDQINAILVK